MSSRAHERRLGWLLCAPAVGVMLLVSAYPLAYAVALSLQRYDLRFPAERSFIGVGNYLDILRSSLWWQDLGNTLLITALSVPIELILAMLLALLMHGTPVFRRSVRTSTLVPYAIVTVVAALAWRYAFDPTTGFVGHWLGPDTAWLGARPSALAVIVLTEVWKTTPFMALLLLAGRAQVPEDLLQAARVDGAGAARRFFTITLPLMKGAIAVALLFRTLDAFRVFDSVFILTRGSVGTETVSILGYQQLLNRLNLGMGSALATLVFASALIIAILLIRGFGISLAPEDDGGRP